VAIERHTAPDEATVLDGDDVRLDRLEKLLALEQLLAVRLGECGLRETAALSREVRECWREIEELTAGDDAGAGADEDELTARRERVAAARRAAAQAGSGP